MKKYDFEAHFYIPEYTGDIDPVKARERNRGLPPEKQNPFLDHVLDLDSRRLAVMDECGIDVQVISFSTGISRLPAEKAVPLCRTINDRLYEAVQKHPTRFAAFAQLPEQDPDAACRELERCMTQLGFWGWNTFSNYGKKHVDDPEYFPILQTASELGAVVYLHPDFPREDPRYNGWGVELLGGLGYTLDTATTITRLICAGVFDRLPELQMILGHLGEGIPFYLDRMGAKSPTPESRLPALNRQDFHYYFDHNIWVTTSGNYSVPSYLCTRDVLGKDRILFASDYPYERAQKAVEFVNGLPISEEEREAVYSGNARKAFRNLP